MTAAPEKEPHEPFVGYFASIVLALVCSAWLAGILLDQFSIIAAVELSQTWRVNFTAGLFLGIAAANPVGTFIAKTSRRRAVLRFALGFFAGAWIQALVFTPFAGDGLSNIMFLMLAGSAVPASLFLDWFRDHLEKTNHALTRRTARYGGRLLNISDRLTFVTLMAVSFAGFWAYTTNIAQVLTVLGAVLGGLVLFVARREPHGEFADDPENAEYQAWLALDPEIPVIDPKQDVIDRLKRIATTLLPAAILFGGMTRLALDFLTVVYPDLTLDISKPMEALQNFGIVAVSGLAAVLFGMMAALGLCILILRLVGTLQNWSSGHFQENYIYLVRLMYFRPLHRPQA